MATLKLTEKTLAALPPATDAVQDYYWDAGHKEAIKGFGVVVGRTGRKTFVARAWVKGLKRRVVIGVAGEPRADGHVWSVALARPEAKKLLGTMAAGTDPNAARRPGAGGPTLRDGLELHLENMREGRGRKKVCSPRSIRKMETEVPRHLGDWLDRPIAELTADELAKVCKRIQANATPIAGSVNKPGVVQANKIIAHVSAIWNALDKRRGLTGRNPARQLGLIAFEKARDVRINHDEFADWHAKVLTCSPVRRDLQLVSLFTGIRSEGVRNLRWEDVDEERELLHVRKAKGDQPYTLPLVATVRDILKRRKTENADEFASWGGDQGWCFPSLSRDMKQVQAVAEVKERRVDKTQEDEDGDPVRVRFLPGIHANRRTFNSVAIEIGVPPEARLALMNHEGRGVNVKHYGRPQNWDYLRGCAEQIEAALWERLKPEPVTPKGAKPKAKPSRGRLRAV